MFFPLHILRLFCGIFITCVVTTSPLLCQDPPDPPDAVTKVGTSAANWLKIENGVRGISMGGAQTASGRGLTGAHYNPASISFIDGSETFWSKSIFSILE